MRSGPADAKVTIVEYASLTCSHCAAFHNDTYPSSRSATSTPGKVRYILREFPLDPLATAGFMLARCDGEAKYYPIVDLLFAQQRTWAFSDKPLDALQQMMRQAGFSQEKFEGCLQDQKLYDAVNAVRNRAANDFKVSSTPTFFINGQRSRGKHVDRRASRRSSSRFWGLAPPSPDCERGRVAKPPGGARRARSCPDPAGSRKREGEGRP